MAEAEKAKVSPEELFRLTEEFKRSDFWKVVLEPALNEEIDVLDRAEDGTKGMENVFAIARYRAGIRLVRSWITEAWSQPPAPRQEEGEAGEVNY